MFEVRNILAEVFANDVERSVPTSYIYQRWSTRKKLYRVCRNRRSRRGDPDVSQINWRHQSGG